MSVTAIRKKLPTASYDSAWKDIIDEYLPQALALCFPALHALVDWEREWIGLDKELEALTKEGKTGKRHLDKLIQVYLKDGQESWILIHFELEQHPRADFPERMLIYGARIYDKHRRPIASCAVLTDRNKRMRPCSYEVGVGNSKLSLHFELCKLIDFEQKREQLAASPLPFAAVILCHLDALLAKQQSVEGRFQVKLSLLRRLYEKGFKRPDVINLYRFLDFSIALPDELELECKEEIFKIEAKKKVAYLSSIERLGIQQGIEQGLQQGIEQGVQRGEYRLLLKQLKQKFSHISKSHERKLANADSEMLLLWGSRILDAKVVEDIFKDS